MKNYIETMDTMNKSIILKYMKDKNYLQKLTHT